MSGQPEPVRPLAGIGVLVTRPARQADNLCRLIEAQGGVAIRFPCLAILPPCNPEAADAVIQRLADFSIAIFVSANAVYHAMELISRRGGELPAGLQRIAVGAATARALERCGAPAQRAPERYDSAGLLALPELQAVAGRSIVIFRGEGGRELLRDALQARGARVTYAEVYRRGKPNLPVDDLLPRWAQGEIHAAVVTSNESLRNLYEIVGKLGWPWLCHTPLIVVSERAWSLARELGFSQPPLVASEASDEAIVDALLRWRQTRSESLLRTTNAGSEYR